MAQRAKALTERDRALLHFVGQGGLATHSQLHQQFWGEAQRRTAYDRVQQLAKAGWLKRETVDVRKPGEIVYTLTAKGAKHFTKPERARLIIGLPAHHELKQQLIAQDVRIALEREYKAQGYELHDWQNERDLRRAQRIGRQGQGRRGRPMDEIGDAHATFVNPTTGEQVELPIEVDGQYYGKMLDKKLKGCRAMGKPMLWATSGGQRAERIRSMTTDSNIRVFTV